MAKASGPPWARQEELRALGDLGMVSVGAAVLRPVGVLPDGAPVLCELKEVSSSPLCGNRCSVGLQRTPPCPL